jgi:hypothetical protein
VAWLEAKAEPSVRRSASVGVDAMKERLPRPIGRRHSCEQIPEPRSSAQQGCTVEGDPLAKILVAVLAEPRELRIARSVGRSVMETDLTLAGAKTSAWPMRTGFAMTLVYRKGTASERPLGTRVSAANSKPGNLG